LVVKSNGGHRRGQNQHRGRGTQALWRSTTSAAAAAIHQNVAPRVFNTAARIDPLRRQQSYDNTLDGNTTSRQFGNALESEELSPRNMGQGRLLVRGQCGNGGPRSDDVRRAKDYGVDGIYCPNHGGRQANGGLSALYELPDVADGTAVLLDSGVRSGSEAAKTLAAEGDCRAGVHLLEPT
jgi:isopentenyl diphosphate isomerase/L-lactate dehydrogenase-like FMN-dependent dehydrogenase